MATEIERKFLVRSDEWKAGARGEPYRQGYLTTDTEASIRVRRAGDRAFLTVKGRRQGYSRLEFEYAIPVQEAEEMLEVLCRRPFIEKTRYRLEYAGKTWEVDVFEGANAGLVIAEVELSEPDEPITLPPWIGQEVTGDERYNNANLVACPYKGWN